MSKCIKRGLSVILTLCILLTLPVISSMAADPAISVTPNAETSTADVAINLPDAAGQEVSIICMDPTFTFEGNDVSGWTANSDKISYIDQIKLDDAGVGSISFTTKDAVVAGNYTMIVGWTGGPSVQQFAFIDAPVPVEYSIKADKVKYDVNEKIQLTIVTPKEINRIGLINEKGLGLVQSDKNVVIEGDAKIWTMTTYFGTRGYRNIGVKVVENGAWSDFKCNVDAAVGVTPISDAAAMIYEANFESASITANSPVTATVVTSTGVSRVAILTENGKGVVNSVVKYEDQEDGTRVWTLQTTLGTVGNRVFTFLAADKDGKFIEANVQASIRVTK